ncbi:MAG: alpha/beta hydrolase [Porticoccaceae bacterium]
MPESESVSIATLDHLRHHLPPLAFDPGIDADSRALAGAADYLRHYRLESASVAPDVRHCMGTLATHGYRIAAHYWLHPAPRGTVFVVHGYFDHVGLYGHLIRHLLGRALNVVAFDLPGHGLSDGERVTIASFDRYTEVLADILARAAALASPWHGVGQSTGGAILIKYLLDGEHPRPLDRIALLAPLVHPRRWGLNRLVYLASHRWREAIDRKFMINSGDPEFLDFVQRRDPLQERHVPLEWIGAMKRWAEELHRLPPSPHPVTLVQGDADTTLDWRYNLRLLRQKLPNGRFHLVPGAQHHLVNEAEPIRTRVFAALGF